MVALIIILFHFALPFALLLSRERKRDGRRLIGLALLLMFMRLVDIYWYVVPNFAHERGNFYLSLWYIVAPIGVGGLWLAFFFYNLRQRPLQRRAQSSTWTSIPPLEMRRRKSRGPSARPQSDAA